MVRKIEASAEMSRRIDILQNEISILKEKTHDNEEASGVVVATVERLSDRAKAIFEEQKKFSEKVIDTFKEHAIRFKEIEEETNKIKLVTSHWKTIVWIIIVSSAIGFSFDNGIKNILKVINGEKNVAVSKIIVEEKNG